MLKDITLFLVFSWAVFVVPVLAQTKPLQTITLKDGSSIQGHLIGVAGEEYVIENETMGQVRVPMSQVVGVNAVGAVPKPATTAQTDQQVMPQLNSAHLTIMQDPQIMALMQEMMADPEVSKLIMDPTLFQAAMTQDPEAIKNNPQAQKLMQNPKMQQILSLTAQKLQASGQLTPQQ